MSARPTVGGDVGEACRRRCDTARWRDRETRRTDRDRRRRRSRSTPADARRRSAPSGRRRGGVGEASARRCDTAAAPTRRPGREADAADPDRRRASKSPHAAARVGRASATPASAATSVNVPLSLRYSRLGLPSKPTNRSRSPSLSKSANALTNEPPADSSSGCTGSKDGAAICAPTITDSVSVSTVSNLGFRMRITSGPGSLLASGRPLSFLCARGAPPPRASRASRDGLRPCRLLAIGARRQPIVTVGPPQSRQPWQPVRPC